MKLLNQITSRTVPGDSLWTNVWNGENRRVVVESRPTLPAAARRKVDWTILADGRWVERIVSTNNGTAYYPAQTNRYVWDNQVLLAVLDHTNGLVLSFTRGLDLSGPSPLLGGAGGGLQGAGGVGGVLFIGHFASAISHHAVAYDGNGNVTALLDAATGEASARYEYAPFAEKLRETGPMAQLNPIRFSTQYADDVTGDTKYLFRDYQVDTGRWPNRDPLGERGGLNLYGMVGNDPVGRIDRLGLQVSGGYPGVPFFTPPQDDLNDEAWRMFIFLFAGDLGENYELSDSAIEAAKSRVNKDLIVADLRNRLVVIKAGRQ